MGVINETRACCLIANGSGYSFVSEAGGVCKSQPGPSLQQRRLQEKRMLSASRCFSLSSHHSPRDRGLPPGTGTWLMSRTLLSRSACVASGSSSCYVSVFFFFFILASCEITAVSDVALQSCPVGGEEGGQVRGLLSAHRVPAVFSFNNCAHHFSHLRASLTILPANKG